MDYQGNKQKPTPLPKLEEIEKPSLLTDIKQLQAELRKAQLHNKLLNVMIDIAERQLEGFNRTVRQDVFDTNMLLDIDQANELAAAFFRHKPSKIPGALQIQVQHNVGNAIVLTVKVD